MVLIIMAFTFLPIRFESKEKNCCQNLLVVSWKLTDLIFQAKFFKKIIETMMRTGHIVLKLVLGKLSWKPIDQMFFMHSFRFQNWDP